MKFKDYIAKIDELVKEKPEVLEMDTYYASDDEGNSFDEVGFTPSIMFMNEEGEVVNESDIEDDPYNIRSIIVVN